MLRSPIVCVLGHVDHGKTSLLDAIRGTSVAAGEPGLITQHIGASFVPKEVFEKKCGNLLKRYKFSLDVPGLLFVDTPGHEAFTNLRKRGGNVADLAILVVDVVQGFQQQTKEAVEILRTFKTPFITAANKIDSLNGWISNKGACFTDTFEKQRDFVQQQLDEKIYDIMRELGKFELNSERFDRADDFTKQIPIVPVSAKTGEGIQELLMFLAGLAQRFMKKRLDIELAKPAKGTILEVKEVEGLGATIDVIIYEGTIRIGDEIAAAAIGGPITTKVRALLQPAPLEEIRDPRKKFKVVPEVTAAAGIKVAAPGLENVIAGSPLLVVKDEASAKKEILEEIKGIKIDKKTAGVIIKTDAFGSLEAVAALFSRGKIPVRKADVGIVTRRDVLEAEAERKQNRYLSAIFAFNTKISEDAKEEAAGKNIKIFESNIIYKLQEDYAKWVSEEKQAEKKEQQQKYVYPGKVKILEGFVFRASRPAVVGIEVLAGTIRQAYPLMNKQGREIGKIESIQAEKKSIDKAEKGMQVAISIDGGVVGRNISERDVLYTSVPLEHIEALEKIIDDKELLAEIKKIKESVNG